MIAAAHTTVTAAGNIPAGSESPPLTRRIDVARIFGDITLLTYSIQVSALNGQIISEGNTTEWMSHVQLARDCHAQNMQVAMIRDKLVFRAIRCIRQGEQLFVWFTEDIAKELGIPFLSPVNIQGQQRYVCHLCGCCFLDPNPLKVHLAFFCTRPIPSVMTPPLQHVSLLLPRPPLPPTEVPSHPRRRHQCLYCGKLYSRKYGLKIHIRTHTGYKPLQCRVCFRPFGDPSNLNKHVRLHAQGDSPYRCRLCGKVLVRRRDLERHIKSRHPDEEQRPDTSTAETKPPNG